MRDEPSDAPIPKKFEPSDHNAKHLAAAQERLDWLNGLSAAEASAEAAKAHAEALDRHRSYEAKKNSLRDKYWKMLEKVSAGRRERRSRRVQAVHGKPDPRLDQIRLSQQL